MHCNWLLPKYSIKTTVHSKSSYLNFLILFWRRDKCNLPCCTMLIDGGAFLSPSIDFRAPGGNFMAIFRIKECPCVLIDVVWHFWDSNFSCNFLMTFGTLARLFWCIDKHHQRFMFHRMSPILSRECDCQSEYFKTAFPGRIRCRHRHHHKKQPERLRSLLTRELEGWVWKRQQKATTASWWVQRATTVALETAQTFTFAASEIAEREVRLSAARPGIRQCMICCAVHRDKRRCHESVVFTAGFTSSLHSYYTTHHHLHPKFELTKTSVIFLYHHYVIKLLVIATKTSWLPLI